ncbi:flagellar assembly protein FliW [Arthrobacter sp. Hz1]
MSPALTFTTPPPGLDPLVDFSLDEIDGADGLYALQASGNASLRLFVLDAAVYLPSYHPAVSSSHVDALDLPETDPLTLLVVANPGRKWHYGKPVGTDSGQPGNGAVHSGHP